MAEAGKSKSPKLTKRRREELTPVERADVAIVEAARPAIESEAGQAIGRVAKLGDEPPMFILSGAVLTAGLLTRRPALTRAGLRMLAAETVAIGFKTFGKNRVDRTRPDALLKDGSYKMEPGGSKRSGLRAFPSGHTAGSFAVAKAASREFGAPVAFLGGALGMGVAQIFRRAHWPSDVVAGSVLGIVAERISRPAIGPVLRLL